MNQSMKDDIQFLKELQQQMRWEDEHDYDSQASPRFWTIMNYRIVPANEDYDSGFTQYHYNDGDHIDFKDFDDLKEFVEEHYEDEVDDYLESLLNDESKHFATLWAHIQNHLNDDGFFGECFVKEEEFIATNTMFLTKEEAKRHLELNHYHYSKKSHTYAMTAWRAPKVGRLLKILHDFNFDVISKDVEMLNKIRAEADDLYAEEIDLSDFGERVANII